MAKSRKSPSRTGRPKTAPSKRRKARSKGPHPIDVHVGNRVRLQRTLRGLSQEKLGEAVGLTFQQIQKYERGSNRIGASRLHEFSQILDVPVSFFFEGMNGPEPSSEKRHRQRSSAAAGQDDHLQKRETLELIRAYYRIPDKVVRKRLFDAIKAVANSTDAKA